MLTLDVALRWMQGLAGVAALVGTLELLVTRASWGDDGTWRWRTLRDEMAWAGPFLSTRGFTLLLGARALTAAGLIVAPSLALAGALWVTSLLVNLRFRGPYNGGSDHMLMIVLTALVVAMAGAAVPVVVQGAMAWVGAQGVLSYWIAGLAKLRHRAWREGSVLPVLVAIPAYGVPARTQRLLSHGAIARVAAWGVLAFECVFPLVLLDERLAWAGVALAAAFHLTNAWTFGLNRFLLVWAATWPAIVALAGMT